MIILKIGITSVFVLSVYYYLRIQGSAPILDDTEKLMAQHRSYATKMLVSAIVALGGVFILMGFGAHGNLALDISAIILGIASIGTLLTLRFWLTGLKAPDSHDVIATMVLMLLYSITMGCGLWTVWQ
ncbi:MAG TPA: hypothetical protein VMU13_01190 [Candidatus Paceibacterota bacterium]|nr:hypothetical protein [Candidatus Paceibacterota bacterium]